MLFYFRTVRFVRFADNFLFRGPVILLRIELGAYNKGKLTNSVIVNMRLNNLQIQEAVEILLSLSSNTEYYLCFSHIIDFLLKVDSFDPYGMQGISLPFSPITNTIIDYLELLFEKSWPQFIEQKSKFAEPAKNLYIRYANRLIR